MQEQNNETNGFGFPKETMLELVQLESGEVVLRPAQLNNDETAEAEPSEPLVSIHFSDQVKEMLGDEVKGIGQHMIHAAIQLVMQQQIASWHANVMDEEPKHYS